MDMYIDFDSLPFPFFESDQEQLIHFKDLAIAREAEIAENRRRRNEKLRKYVENRLKEWDIRRQQQRQRQLLEKQKDSLLLEPDQIQSSTEKKPKISSAYVNKEINKTSFSQPKPVISTGYTSPVYKHSMTSTHTKPTQCHVIYNTVPVETKQVSGIVIRSPPKWKPPPLAPVWPQNIPVYQTSYNQLRPHEYKHDIGTIQMLSKPNEYIIKQPLHLSSSTNKNGRQVEKDPVWKITAIAKGFLTRRLLKAEKIQDIIITIKDAERVLQTLDNPVTPQDFDLQQRVINQLQTAKITLHDIFFVIPVRERMLYITHSRKLRRERLFKKTEENKRNRLSAATVKSLERKNKSTKTSSITATRSSITATRSSITTTSLSSTGKHRDSVKKRIQKPSSLSTKKGLSTEGKDKTTKSTTTSRGSNSEVTNTRINASSRKKTSTRIPLPNPISGGKPKSTHLSRKPKQTGSVKQ